MHLKQGDLVKLSPKWAFMQSAKAPVWGGPFGYHIGRVQKTITGSHNPSDHLAVVEWSNKEVGEFPEGMLLNATNDDSDVDLDAKTPLGPVDIDIWVLIRTSLNNFALGCIECLPFGAEEPHPRYIAAFSRNALPSVENTDYNLVGTFISSPDFTETRTSNLYAAAQQIFHSWDLPELDSVPLPLPRFASITEAARSAPGIGPAVLFFHLPLNLNDYSDYPAQGAS